MKVCKYASMHVYASMKYASMQVGKYASICKYAHMQVCSYMQVCTINVCSSIILLSCCTPVT